MAPSTVSQQPVLATMDARILPSLQQRQKWKKPQRNLAVNDIALLQDKNTPRSSWPFGRVIAVYSNRRDGLVRSAKVKTRSPRLVQPVDKIVLLESSSEDAIDASKDQEDVITMDIYQLCVEHYILQSIVC